MSKKKCKVVSLFSGIGGFEVGLHMSNLNHKVVFASEIDKHAITSYKANFNEVEVTGDITKVNENSVPEHDFVCAGFPCQSFSIAGHQNGFEDTRGTLFFEVARILKEKKPKYILLENVKNLISHDNSKTIKIILATLNELDYTVDFSVVNSNEVGLPQNRDRTYIVGIHKLSSEKFDDDLRSKKVTALKRELNECDYSGFNFFNHLIISKKIKSIQDILEKKVDEKYYLNNPDLGEFLNNIEYEESKAKQNKIVKLFDLPREVHNDLERQRRVYSILGISPTVLARSDSTKILVKNNGELCVRKFTPAENFYVQGFGETFVENIKKAGLSDTQLYKQSGNAVSPPMIAEIVNYLVEVYIDG